MLLPAVLDAEGVTPRQRQLRVRTGEWRRLPCGVLAVAGVPITFEMLATAALAAWPDAALSHQSSLRAQVAGERFEGDDRLHLLVAPGGMTRARGAVVHQAVLGAGDVVQRRGFRVTSIERTLVDLGATMGRASLQRCIEDHLVRGTTTYARLEATYLRLLRPGPTGIARTRQVLEALDGQPPNESELEARFGRLLAARSLPTPQRQVTFEWGDGERGRVDVWFPEANLIVELDGRTFHARLAAFERDRQRDQTALVAGVRTVRFTHHQLADDPARVAAVLRSLLDTGRISCDS